MKKEESKIKSADDLIIQDEAAKLGKPIPELKTSSEKAEPNQTDIQEKAQTAKTEEASQSNSEQSSTSESSEEKTEEKESEPESAQDSEIEQDKAPQKTSENDEIDEYGTKIAKKKMYSEEEVQRMIRERLARGKQAEQTPQQQREVQQAAKDFTPDPESADSWEVQLEAFVNKAMDKRDQVRNETEWKQREQESQAEFEVKFSEGMTKYHDFNGIVGGKPITNAMMLATRSMKDPAAFLYAACKQQPKELARIAAIPDAVTQAAEIGRLEERMKKAKVITTAPRPAKKISGDASSELPQIDIDSRIAAHAKSRIMR